MFFGSEILSKTGFFGAYMKDAGIFFFFFFESLSRGKVIEYTDVFKGVLKKRGNFLSKQVLKLGFFCI